MFQAIALRFEKLFGRVRQERLNSGQTRFVASRRYKSNLLIMWLIHCAVFFGLILLVNETIGWEAILQPWQRIDITSALPAILLLVTSYMIRALRLVDYFSEIPFKSSITCLRLSVIHNMYNNLLPMRTGELAFPVLMSKEFNISYKKSTSALIWLRTLDLLCILLVAAITLLFIWGLKAAAIALILTSMVLPLWLSRFLNYFYDGLTNRFPSRRSFLDECKQGWPRSHYVAWKSWLWTVLNWLVKLLTYAIVLLWFLDLDIYRSILGIIGAELTSVLPVHSIAGAGSYESGIIISLSLLDVSPVNSAKAAINLHLFVIGMTLFSGLIATVLRAIFPATATRLDNVNG